MEQPRDETAPGAIAAMRLIEQRTKLQSEADNLLAYYEELNIDTQVKLKNVIKISGTKKKYSIIVSNSPVCKCICIEHDMY